MTHHWCGINQIICDYHCELQMHSGSAAKFRSLQDCRERLLKKKARKEEGTKMHVTTKEATKSRTCDFIRNLLAGSSENKNRTAHHKATTDGSTRSIRVATIKSYQSHPRRSTSVTKHLTRSEIWAFTRSFERSLKSLLRGAELLS